MSWKDKEYDVGYGKPPASNQFKKGKSGNPKGRPRGTRNLFTDLEEVLSKKVSVFENGKKKNVSAQMATIQRLCEKALMGDQKIDRVAPWLCGTVGKREGGARCREGIERI